ncbi:MAG: hypothetical protein HY343_04170, partial [Lentisphaerae bacterium]|nr:hypothetical protein [Lentisphaerota bacterium]
MVDGNDAEDDTVIRAGETLTFVTRAGEKGAAMKQLSLLLGMKPGTLVPYDEDEVRVQGKMISVQTPEGISGEMRLSDLLKSVTERKDTLRSVCWPAGVRHVFSEWPMAVVVVELPAAVCRAKWISRDSPVPYGPESAGCKYDLRTLSMPYILMFATFAWHPAPTGDGEAGGLRLTQRCEVFFRREPLHSLDDELLLPALLNASKYRSKDNRFDVPAKNIVWFCTQHAPLKPYDHLPI